MSLVLVRIDDRLIHGQVTVGWGSFLNPDRILLVSDEIANNDWEKELYESCVPFNMKVSILTVEKAAEALKENTYREDRTILLAENPKIIVDLVNLGAELKQVNIGGMHHKPEKKKLLSYVFVDHQDTEYLKSLLTSGIELVCQDLPQAKKENLADLLN